MSRLSNDDEALNVLGLQKGQEYYLFLFRDDGRAEALRALGRFAANPDLTFTWHDAAVLSQRIAKLVAKEESP